jgi:hypothetical protein
MKTFFYSLFSIIWLQSLGQKNMLQIYRDIEKSKFSKVTVIDDREKNEIALHSFKQATNATCSP